MKTFSKYTVEIQFDGQTITENVKRDSFVIGRSSDSDIHIESKNLSRQHMRVSLVGNEIFIEDLKSTNGCFLDGEQIESEKLILYTPDKVLTLGKKEDVIIKLKAVFEIENVVTPKEVKDNLSQIFNKDPLSLEDPPPAKAERNYKEIMNQVEIVKTEIIDRAEKRADKILEDAKVEAEKLISQSKESSEALLSEARSDADKMLADAVEQSKNIKEQTDLADILKQIEEKKNELERVNDIISTCRENLKTLETKNTEYLELANKITELDLNIKNLETKNNSLIDNQKDLEAKVSLASKDLEKLTSEKVEITTYLAETEKKCKSLVEETDQRNQILIDDTDKKNQALISETQRKNAELIEESEKKNKALIHEIGNYEIQFSKLTEKKNRITEEIASLENKKQQYDNLNVSYASLEKNLELKNNDFKSLLLEIQKVNSDLKELKDLNQSLNSESTRQRTQIDDDNKTIEKLKKEQQDYINKNKTLNADIEELVKKKESATSDLNDLNKKSLALDKEAKDKIKRASDEADLIISQSKAKAQSEYITMMQKSKQDLIDKEQVVMDQAKNQAKEILDRATAEAKKAAAELKAQSDDNVLKAEQKVEKLVKDSQQRADELRDKARDEYQKIVEEAKSEADKIKIHTIQIMDEKKKDFVELEKKKIRKSAEVLKSELNVLLYSKLKLYLKEDSDEYTARVKASLDSAVNASMLNEVLENDDEMYALLDDKVLKQQQKTINYWRYTVPGVITALIVIYFAVPFFKEKIKDESRRVASVSQQEAKNRVIKKEQEAKQALIEYFTPKKSSEFKSTYTDRVLYTEGYAELSLEKEYREDWILELQTFFVDKLKLSENALVPFISQEANMIRELVAQSKRINGNFIESGISKMREIEDEFLVKLKENLRSEKDFDKIMDFQKKFFNKRIKK